MMKPVSYFPFQPVLDGWCNKGCGTYCSVSAMSHILLVPVTWIFKPYCSIVGPSSCKK